MTERLTLSELERYPDSPSWTTSRSKTGGLMAVTAALRSAL